MQVDSTVMPEQVLLFVESGLNSCFQVQTVFALLGFTLTDDVYKLSVTSAANVQVALKR
jgi:hypothetical protein